MITFDQLRQWSKMPVKQRYNLTVGIIIVVLCAVIIYYEKKVNLKNEQHRLAITSIVDRYTTREASLEAKLDVCNQNYLLYLQKSEKEYRELLFEAKKLKEKIEDEDIK